MSRRFLIKEVPVLIYTLNYTNHLIDMMNLDITIHLDNERSEQAIKAVLDALGVKYDEAGEQPVRPNHVVAGVRKSQEDLKAGRVKDYKGLNVILGRH